LPSAFSLALGKQPLCRVPDKKDSAKSGTLGKEAVSGSDYGLDLDYWRTPIINYLRKPSAKVDKSIMQSAFRFI